MTMFGSLGFAPNGRPYLQTLNLQGQVDGQYDLMWSQGGAVANSSYNPVYQPAQEWVWGKSQTHVVYGENFTMTWGHSDTYRLLLDGGRMEVEHDVFDFSNYNSPEGSHGWSQHVEDFAWSDWWGAGESHTETTTLFQTVGDLTFTDTYIDFQSHTFHDDGYFLKG